MLYDQRSHKHSVTAVNHQDEGSPVYDGDVVPPSILDEITAVAGHPTADASWVADNAAEESLLSDQAIDWIQEAANDEGAEGE